MAKKRSNQFGTMVRRYYRERHMTQRAFAARIREMSEGRAQANQCNVSQITLGYRRPPAHWMDGIVAALGLNPTQRQRLEQALEKDYPQEPSPT